MSAARGLAVVAVLATIGIAAGSGAATGSSASSASSTSSGRHRPTLIHQTYDERPIATHLNGLGPGCPDFTGTMTERRHLVVSGYRRGDTVRVSTEVTATVTLVPDDPATVSYRGRYRSVQIGTFGNHGRRDDKVATFTLGHVRGSDGSAFGTIEEARTWRDSTGRAHQSDRFHCDGVTPAP